MPQISKLFFILKKLHYFFVFRLTTSKGRTRTYTFCSETEVIPFGSTGSKRQELVNYVLKPVKPYQILDTVFLFQPF